MKFSFFPLKCPNSIQIHHMKVDIKIKASSKTLDKAYRACLCSEFFPKTRFFIRYVEKALYAAEGRVPRACPGESICNGKNISYGFRVSSKKKPEGEKKA